MMLKSKCKKFALLGSGAIVILILGGCGYGSSAAYQSAKETAADYMTQLVSYIQERIPASSITFTSSTSLPGTPAKLPFLVDDVVGNSCGSAQNFGLTDNPNPTLGSPEFGVKLIFPTPKNSGWSTISDQVYSFFDKSTQWPLTSPLLSPGVLGQQVNDFGVTPSGQYAHVIDIEVKSGLSGGGSAYINLDLSTNGCWHTK